MTGLRRTAIHLLLALLAALAAAGRAEAEVRYGQPFPSGRVGYARPPIGVLVVTTGGDAVSAGTLELDGVRRPVYREGNLVVYHPDEPLAPGTHTARLQVHLAGRRWRPIELAWQFTVVPGALDELPPPAPETLEAVAELNR